MDLGAAVRFLYDHNELILGVSLVLFLILTVLILVRSVLEGRAAAQQEDAAPALDVDQLNSALEQALSKALKQDRPRPRPIEGEEGSTDEDYADSELQAALEEKEAKIEALLADLDVLKRQIEASASAVAPAAQGGVAVSGGDPAETEAMKKQLSDLQAKLAEYELFEEDISNVSSLTEENARLKAELDKLRAALETAQTQVQSAKTSVAEAAPLPTPPQVPTPPAAPAPAPAAAFQLDPADDVMREYAEAMKGLQAEPERVELPLNSEPEVAAKPPPEIKKEKSLITNEEVAVDPQAAIEELMRGGEAPSDGEKVDVGLDPAAAALAELEAAAAESPPQLPSTDGFDLGAFDTDKLLAEATELKVSADAADEPMGEMSFDTDKLMAEAGGMKEAVTAPTSAPAPPQAQPATTLAAKVAPPAPASVSASASGPSAGSPSTARDQTGADLLPQVELEDDLLGEFQDLSPNTTDTKSKG